MVQNIVTNSRRGGECGRKESTYGRFYKRELFIRTHTILLMSSLAYIGLQFSK